MSLPHILLMGPFVSSSAPALSPTRLTSTTTRRILAGPLRNLGRSSYETSREFKRCTAAFLTRNKKPADGLPALPCSGISFSCTSGVSLQQLSIQISRQLSSATGAAANDSFSASEKDTDTPTLPHDLRVSTQPRTSKDEVLSALEAVKRSADSGSLYILETVGLVALPQAVTAPT